LPLEAILLDLDDTLLDERPGRVQGRAVLIRTLCEARPELAAEEVAAELDRQTHWFWGDPVRHASGRLDLPGARLEIVSRALERLAVRDEPLVAESVRRYIAVRDAALTWMPGAREALAALRAAVPRLALLTNGAAGAQRAKLERFDLARHFDHVQIEGAAGFGKPSPRAFEHALAVLGATCERAVMVGNDFEFDVLGATRAGLAAVWIDVEGTDLPPQPAPRPFRAVRSIEEVPGALAALG
jgi:putative hydrolase of the HAD superfamily